jgi:SAM-dependent methyltransferase
VSNLGQRLGLSWMTYNPVIFQHFHEHAVRNAPAVAGALTETFPEARRFADVGSGSGAFAAELLRHGVSVQACEHGRAGRRMAERQGVDVRPFDLMSDPPAKLDAPFDVAYCFEVAEHVPPDLGDRLVAFTASLAPIAVFSAARPGQGGIGHIHEQPQEYWVERFARVGKTHDAETSARLAERFAAGGVTGDWFSENVMVYR